MENLKDKVVLITGATSGIGEATARCLAANGAKVVLSGRREDRLLQLAKELQDQAIYLKSDVTKVEDMLALVKLAKEKWGKIDVLFANAGIMPAGKMAEGDHKGWMNMIDINIKGVLNAMYAVIRNSMPKIQDMSSSLHPEPEPRSYREMPFTVEQNTL